MSFAGALRGAVQYLLSLCLGGGIAGPTWPGGSLGMQTRRLIALAVGMTCAIAVLVSLTYGSQLDGVYSIVTAARDSCRPELNAFR